MQAKVKFGNAEFTVKQYIKIVARMTNAANYCRKIGRFEAEAIIRDRVLMMTFDLLRAEREAIGA